MRKYATALVLRRNKLNLQWFITVHPLKRLMLKRLVIMLGVSGKDVRQPTLIHTASGSVN